MTHYLFLLGFIALLQYSCLPSYVASEGSNYKSIPQSKFANTETIGMNKDDIIKKFGQPLSVSVEKQQGILYEGLYYLEILADIQMVTIISLEDGIATAQKIDQITSNYDDRLKNLERNIKILQTPRLYN